MAVNTRLHSLSDPRPARPQLNRNWRRTAMTTGTSDKVHASRVAAREYVRALDWFDALRRERAPSENVMVAVAQRVMAKATQDLLGSPELVLDDVLDEWRG